MKTTRHRTLATLLLVYAIATLIHFTHNAEFVADYPNLPASWTRGDVYLAWLAVSAVGMIGWLVVARGHLLVGLPILAIYAMLGLDSLGHYVLAPLSSHTWAMNSTILLEVTAAALVLVEVSRQMLRSIRSSRRGEDLLEIK